MSLQEGYRLKKQFIAIIFMSTHSLKIPYETKSKKKLKIKQYHFYKCSIVLFVY